MKLPNSAGGCILADMTPLHTCITSASAAPACIGVLAMMAAALNKHKPCGGCAENAWPVHIKQLLQILVTMKTILRTLRLRLRRMPASALTSSKSRRLAYVNVWKENQM